jgi:hypothetical protein
LCPLQSTACTVHHYIEHFSDSILSAALVRMNVVAMRLPYLFLIAGVVSGAPSVPITNWDVDVKLEECWWHETVHVRHQIMHAVGAIEWDDVRADVWQHCGH